MNASRTQLFNEVMGNAKCVRLTCDEYLLMGKRKRGSLQEWKWGFLREKQSKAKHKKKKSFSFAFLLWFVCCGVFSQMKQEIECMYVLLLLVFNY